jgi:hypothetical protein
VKFSCRANSFEIRKRVASRCDAINFNASGSADQSSIIEGVFRPAAMAANPMPANTRPVKTTLLVAVYSMRMGAA